jgi:hypothetical protein
VDNTSAADAPPSKITKAREQETTASESPLCPLVYREKSKKKVGGFLAIALGLRLILIPLVAIETMRNGSPSATGLDQTVNPGLRPA